jgi:mRNA interferase RelE/StbE
VTYTIQILPVASRAIRKLPPEAKRRVQAMIELLAEDARPPASTKLTARAEWRVRSGDYRVLYRIEDTVLTVIIVDAGHRREIYRRQ